MQLNLSTLTQHLKTLMTLNNYEKQNMCSTDVVTLKGQMVVVA